MAWQLLKMSMENVFVECEPEQMPIGTYVDNNAVSPVTELDKSIQRAITETFGKGGDY